MKPFKAYFFDMDGVLFDSMPYHAIAWERVMNAHGMPFTRHDGFLNEGRTGQSVIAEGAQKAGITLTEEQIWAIYQEKSDTFHSLGEAKPMRGIHDVLNYINNGVINREAITSEAINAAKPQIWIVTGSGQRTLFAKLNTEFPGIFSPERMITAYDVQFGKPNPEPYLKAWERSGLPKEDCCVIENAPLGVRAGHAAGLFTIGVNTGPLDEEDLRREGADLVLPDMPTLLTWLQSLNS